MSRLSVARTCSLVFVATCLVSVPAALAQAPPPTVKRTVAPKTPVNDGALMFKQYCAACHGAHGKGDGPAATALKSTPANLSELSVRNGGKFPAQKVEQILRHGIANPAHGTTDMPTWGPTFQAMGDESTVRLRIANISAYLETLQVKPTQ